MKKNMIIAVLLSYCAVWSGERAVHVGVLGGMTFPDKTISHFWNASPAAGGVVGFCFNDLMPAQVSAAVSHHERKLNPVPDARFALTPQTDLYILQVSAALLPAFPRTSSFAALGSAGASMTMFIASNELPPQENADESEIGLELGGGFRYRFAHRLTAGTVVLANRVFTEPYRTNLYSVRLFLTAELGRERGEVSE